MKKVMAGLLVGLVAAAAMAKDATLFDEMDSWKMYTRPEVSLSDLNGENATLVSLSVGWMLNDKLSLGPSGTVLLRDVETNKGQIDSFDLWYAGLRAEYTLMAGDLLHASAAVILGGGDLTVEDRDDTNGFLVVEPSVNVAVNAWDWVEIGVGVGYRFTDSVEVGGYDEDDLQDWNLSLFARFTEF